MKGVSTGVIEIQKDFLDFEIKYKSTQNVFDEIYKLTKIIKRVKMDDINERSYKLAAMFVELSEKYLSTKVKLMEINNDYSLLDDYVKQVVLTMMEQNNTLLTDIELNLKLLLSMLLERKIVPQQKINKIIQKEDKSKDLIIFVSKYETVNSYDYSEHLYSIFLRENLRKCAMIFLMFLLLLFVPAASEDLLDLINSFSSTVSDTVSSEGLAVAPSFSNYLLVDVLIKIVKTITSIFLLVMLNIFTFQIIAELLYITLPVFRPFLNNMVSKSLGLIAEDMLVPVQIEKFKLVRAKEIIESIKGISEYSNSPVIVALEKRLQNKTINEVLTLNDNYAILLVEELYNLVNTYYNTNKELVDYSLGLVLNNFERSHKLLKVLVLKERLGIN